MKNKSLNSELSHKMASDLQLACLEDSHGSLSERMYSRVVESYRQMRDSWNKVYDDMEDAALQIRQELNLDMAELTETVDHIVTHAEEQVSGFMVTSEQPAILPYDYKSFAKLTQFLNLLTCGQLAQRCAFAHPE